MNTRAICEGQFTLPLPVTEAVPLFTTEVESRGEAESLSPGSAHLAADGFGRTCPLSARGSVLGRRRSDTCS